MSDGFLASGGAIASFSPSARTVSSSASSSSSLLLLLLLLLPPPAAAHAKRGCGGEKGECAA